MPTLDRNDLDNLYRQSQRDRGKHAEQWRRVAESDIGLLSSWMTSVPLSDDCALFEVYEGVARCDPLPVTFFLSELDRLLAMAEREPRNAHLYSELTAFAFLDGKPPAMLQEQIRARLVAALESRVPQVRRCAASLLGDFLPERIDASHVALRERLVADADWRVRFLAHQSLTHFQKDFPGSAAEPVPELSFVDRIRINLLGEHRAREIAA